jgi:CRP-like cAMP-binding protein
MHPVHEPEQNRLLRAFTSEERDRLYPHLKLVSMPLGRVLCEPHQLLHHVFFPTSSIVSMLFVLADGATAELSVVGNEGISGTAPFMGQTSPTRVIVRSAGYAYRLGGVLLQDEFQRNGNLQLLLLRHTQALLVQMAQSAVCNRHHSVDQQLCRWLLFSLDRLPGNELTVTQELIANMLGVRREAVNEAASKLQRLGIIQYHRGRISVLDRPRLEALCCECYATVRNETERLLPPVPAPRRRAARSSSAANQ